MTEDEMVGCHHQLDRHEFEQALGVGDGQARYTSSASVTGLCFNYSFPKMDAMARLNHKNVSKGPGACENVGL